MQNGIQSVYLTMGEEACFFFQLLNIAEKEIGYSLDPFTVALICKAKGYIYLNTNDLKDKQNFLVTCHEKVLELITGEEWEYEKVGTNYRKKIGEYIINEYQNGSFKHFDSDSFHSLQNSETVKNGRVISKRVFRHK